MSTVSSRFRAANNPNLVFLGRATGESRHTERERRSPEKLRIHCVRTPRVRPVRPRIVQRDVAVSKNAQPAKQRQF